MQEMHNKKKVCDRVMGMIVGVALGDALGMPHEFFTGKALQYTGVIEHDTIVPSRYKKAEDWKRLPAGRVSDDTELTLALMRSLARNDGFCEDDVILSYERWANSCPAGMGNNTRALFCNIKTVKTYRAKAEVHFSKGVSQSNGALMRCSSLFALPESVALKDCNLTNPCETVRDCILVQLRLLRAIIIGGGCNVKDLCSDVRTVVKEAITCANGSHTSQRNFAANKGWCMHGVYSSIFCYHAFDTFEEAIEWTIKQGGDTDTNGAIAGAVMGAHVGYKKLMSNDVTRETGRRR